MVSTSIITYDGLPISSGGGHTLRTRSALLAWEQVRNFTAACSDTKQPQDASFSVLTGANIRNDFSAPLVARFKDELGVPRQQALGADTAFVWSITPQQIDTYTDFIEKTTPLPIHPYKLQPIAVTATFKFSLVDRYSRIALPNQGVDVYGNFSPSCGLFLGESYLYARISERSTVSLFLNFPFEEITESFQKTVAFVQEHLPFALSDNHWKQWRRTKKGTSYVGRKIDIHNPRT
jgi:hypothetical protein